MLPNDPADRRLLELPSLPPYPWEDGLSMGLAGIPPPAPAAAELLMGEPPSGVVPLELAAALERAGELG